MIKKGDKVLVLIRSQSWPYAKQERAVVTKVLDNAVQVKIGKVHLVRDLDEVKKVR